MGFKNFLRLLICRKANIAFIQDKKGGKKWKSQLKKLKS